MLTGHNHFDHAVEDWLEYCRGPRVQISSSSQSVIDCDSYKRIVSIGRDALPLIRQMYDKDSSDNPELSIIQDLGLVAVVKDIIGDDFQIPEQIKGKISAMKDYTIYWLDKYLLEYIS